MYWRGVERLLLTLWVGVLVGVGYLAVPILFNTLEERMLAGMLAGKMFSMVSVVGLLVGWVLVVSTLYFAGKEWASSWRFWLLFTMVVLVALGLFWLQPMMSDLKALGIEPGSTVASRFGMLHGISSVMYLVVTVGGVALVLFGLRPMKEVE